MENVIFGNFIILFKSLTACVPTKWLHSVRLPTLTFLLTEIYSYSHYSVIMTIRLSVPLARPHSHSSIDACVRVRRPAVSSVCIAISMLNESLNISDDMSRLYITRSFCILFKREPNYFVFL